MAVPHPSPLPLGEGTLDYWVMPYCLVQSAVLHALGALGAGHGRGIVGENNKAADGGPGKQGAQEMLHAGDDVFGEAPRQVSVGGHESGEAESGVDHPADEGLVVGGRPAVGHATDHWRQKSSAKGRRRTTDISRAILRRRALMRDLIWFIG